MRSDDVINQTAHGEAGTACDSLGVYVYNSFDSI